MEWIEEFPSGITVCDASGVIVCMNKASRKTFEKPGEGSLVGKSLLDCHPEPARSELSDMLKNPRVNSYTIEKKGIKKLIHQSPWYKDGKFTGYVEFSIVIPVEMVNHVRKP